MQERGNWQRDYEVDQATTRLEMKVSAPKVPSRSRTTFSLAEFLGIQNPPLYCIWSEIGTFLRSIWGKTWLEFLGQKSRRFWWRLFKSTDPTETRNDSAITDFTGKYSIIKL